MRYTCLSALFLVACGSARSDPFDAPQPDASSDTPTAQDTPQTGCAAVEGMGCACGAIVVGRWHCAGDTPVCVCPVSVMDSGAVRPDAPDVPRAPSDVAIPFPCAMGSLYCASIRACVDVAVNRNHCGACDRACASSEMCARGSCVHDAGVTPSADVPPDVPPACTNRHYECDRDPMTVCETDTASDAFNCGSCGRVCYVAEVNTHTRHVCAASRCEAQCLAGWWSCDGISINGCESRSQTSSLCVTRLF